VTRRRSTGRVSGLMVLALLAHTAHGQAETAAEFVVGDMRVEGLQRISEGTVYNYLPVNIGDRIDKRRVQEALRALYNTDFFREVELRRDGNTLVIVVLERPSIESFELSGNKDIKTEDLEKSLKSVGLARGKTFDRSVLDEVTQFLTDQYFSRGKYGVRIETQVEELPGNRVKLKIDIAEGKRARIRQVNIVGNRQFDDEEILAQFELRTPNWLSWYKQDDRYAREALQGDLEKLRSFYMDRGYANFRAEPPQVTISPGKDDIFITINVHEGDVYRVSEVKIAGNLVVPEAELRRLLVVSPGEIFSNRLVTATQEYITYRLGVDGYAFARVEPIPTHDETKKEVSLTFFVDPGHRVYVRRINFLGTSSINDEVLRREMRQLEGGWLSNQAVERSKQLVQRLPYVESVEYETTPVPGVPDLVDVDFTVKEGLPGQFGGGIGYSESQKFILNGNIVHANFLGTGQRLSAEISGGDYSTLYNLSHFEPYWTIDGVSRSLTLNYREVRQLTSESSEFSTETWAGGGDVGYPVAENQRVRFGLTASHAEFATTSFSSTQLQDWVRENGKPFEQESGQFTLLGTRFDAFELTANWTMDSRDRVIFPSRGTSHRFTLSSTVPGSEVEYWSAVYDYEQFLRLPLLDFVPIRAHARVAYAEAFGDTTSVPPHRHFYLGGPDSVRGFAESTLGPRDSLGNPYGGDLLVAGQIEAILPMPAKFASSARLSLFYDFGQLAYLGDTQFTDRGGFAAEYPFDVDLFRTSVGVAVQWLAPLGLFRFSYAHPLRRRENSELNHGDEIERFQFSIGQAF
jgi:outer membrane protein insertion porin family